MGSPQTWFAALAAADATVAQGEPPMGGWFALLPTLELGMLLALGGALVVLLRLLQRAQRMAELVESQTRAVEQLHALLSRGLAQRSDLDLRRLEHVLIDIRDGQGRLEDRLVQARPAAPAGAGSVEGSLSQATGDPVDGLLERVYNRLHALGYDRVQWVGERSNLEELVEGRGSLAVEARRGGAVHKGRVLIHAGRILDVQMRPPFAMFP